ncbi:MAG: phosphatidate cytidylyltransferase, partial [Kiritimatiellae bacterium]|nr:phosphatidate cytidylyltransferase [Kiritimatiellia bacterium]
AVLAMVEFALLMKMKSSRPGAVHAVVFLAGALLIGYGLLSLASVPLRYGEGEVCGPFRLGNVMLLYVIAIVKFSDVGGFAFGLTSAKLMKGGNHKLCPTISPNKSWEGLLGSVAVSSLVSCLFMGATGFGWGKSLALGAAAALLGTAGDLVESKFKRWVGVKDSSAMKMTNGLGGILDMIDSLLIAPPVLLAFL